MPKKPKNEVPTKNSVAKKSTQWLERLGISGKTVARLYNEYNVVEFSESVYAREVFNYLCARELRNPLSVDDAFVFDNWRSVIASRMDREAQGFLAGALEFSRLHLDFAFWAFRTPNHPFYKSACRMIQRYISTGKSEIIPVSESPDMYADVCEVAADIYKNGKLSARFLLGFGDRDIRALDFYKNGIFDEALIARFLDEDVDAELAVTTLTS